MVDLGRTPACPTPYRTWVRTEICFILAPTCVIRHTRTYCQFPPAGTGLPQYNRTELSVEESPGEEELVKSAMSPEAVVPSGD